MNPSLDQSRETRLIGWKRIASHLGCSERTARRWESEEQLPVHRQQHENRSTVYAVPSELDAWIGARTELSASANRPRAPKRWVKGWIPITVSGAILTFVVTIAAIAFLPGGESKARAAAPMSEDAVAIDLYERGRSLWLQRGEIPNERAIKLLTEAVERDEMFAEAWAALASAWLTYPTYSDDVTAERAVDEALLASDRAIQLDPTLAEPRSVMATIAQRQGDWFTSERVFRSALDADPDNPTLMLWFAGHYRELGMMVAAQELTEAALEIEPNSPPTLSETAMNKFHIGEVEEAGEMLDYLWFDLGIETPIIWVGRWFNLIERGDYDAALVWIEETPFKSHSSEFEAFIEILRDPETIRREGFTSQIKVAHENGLPSWLAYHMLDQSGFTEAALDVMETESRDGLFDTSVILFYPRGGSAFETARFADLIERLGFYEYWRANGAPDICQIKPKTSFCMRITQ